VARIARVALVAGESALPAAAINSGRSAVSRYALIVARTHCSVETSSQHASIVDVDSWKMLLVFLSNKPREHLKLLSPMTPLLRPPPAESCCVLFISIRYFLSFSLSMASVIASRAGQSRRSLLRTHSTASQGFPRRFRDGMRTELVSSRRRPSLRAQWHPIPASQRALLRQPGATQGCCDLIRTPKLFIGRARKLLLSARRPGLSAGRRSPRRRSRP